MLPCSSRASSSSGGTVASVCAIDASAAASPWPKYGMPSAIMRSSVGVPETELRVESGSSAGAITLVDAASARSRGASSGSSRAPAESAWMSRMLIVPAQTAPARPRPRSGQRNLDRQDLGAGSDR